MGQDFGKENEAKQYMVVNIKSFKFSSGLKQSQQTKSSFQDNSNGKVSLSER